MYKKVYVEITNNCNLNCSFCIHNDRDKKFMTLSEFEIILSKLKNHTKYLYFHILGEPLLHPLINEFINKAIISYYVNITTNGYLIDKIKDNQNIRQLNISLHSFNSSYKLSLSEYMNNIFDTISSLSNTYISYRLWVNNEYNDQIISFLEEKYHVKIDKNKRSNKLSDKIYLDFNDEFIWPDLKNNLNLTKGKCYALRDHLGILVDGTVIPCCLDSKGTINLGNIYKEDIESIKNKERYKKMYMGFTNYDKIEPLCQNCNFLK